MKSRHRAAICATILGITGLLSGCGKEPPAAGAAATSTQSPTAVTAPEPSRVCLSSNADAVVLVVAVHANASSGSVKTAHCAVSEALLKGLAVSAVSVEGAPRMLVNQARLRTKANNDARQKADASALTNDVMTKIAQATATSDGADLVAAMAMAADSANASGAKHPQLIVVDPALSDRGAMNLTLPGMLVADPAEVAAEVKKAGQCPAFRGAAVDLVGLGYGVAPQRQLTPRDRAQVNAIHAALVEVCGGKANPITVPMDGAGPVTSHPVKTVDPSGYATPTTTARAGGTVTFRGESIGFHKDSDQFRDAPAAEESLREVVAFLKANPQVRVTITGTTADGPTAWPSLQDLATARARAAARVLIENGVAEKNIDVKGLGYVADPPQVDAATAALNRRITFAFSG